jgi:hypothetical protein
MMKPRGRQIALIAFHAVGLIVFDPDLILSLFLLATATQEASKDDPLQSAQVHEFHDGF